MAADFPPMLKYKGLVYDYQRIGRLEDLRTIKDQYLPRRVGLLVAHQGIHALYIQHDPPDLATLPEFELASTILPQGWEPQHAVLAGL